MSRRRRRGSATRPEEGRDGLHPLRAPADQLDALHALIADVLIAEITRRMERTKRSPKRSYFRSGLVSAAISYLKLCGVTSPSESDERIDRLIELMPSFDEE